jgi:hypothetical protein
MYVIRNGVNLTRLSNASLIAIYNTLCVEPAVEASCVRSIANYCVRGRKDVLRAVCAIEAYEAVKTVRVRFAPSEESRAWSDSEGGHVFDEIPVIDVLAASKGQIAFTRRTSELR